MVSSGRNSSHCNFTSKKSIPNRNRFKWTRTGKILTKFKQILTLSMNTKRMPLNDLHLSLTRTQFPNEFILLLTFNARILVQLIVLYLLSANYFVTILFAWLSVYCGWHLLLISSFLYELLRKINHKTIEQTHWRFLEWLNDQKTIDVQRTEQKSMPLIWQSIICICISNWPIQMLDPRRSILICVLQWKLNQFKRIVFGGSNALWKNRIISKWAEETICDPYEENKENSYYRR